MLAAAGLQLLDEGGVFGTGKTPTRRLGHALRVKLQERGAVDPEAWEYLRFVNPRLTRRQLPARFQVEPEELGLFHRDNDVLEHAGFFVVLLLRMQVNGARAVSNFAQ